jgi:hypothetical protein
MYISSFQKDIIDPPAPFINLCESSQILPQVTTATFPALFPYKLESLLPRKEDMDKSVVNQTF